MKDSANSCANVAEYWEHTSVETQSALVLPDGCRDLIGTVTPDGEPSWFVSALQDSVLVKPVAAGQCFIGFRLQAGIQIDEERLLLAVQKRDLLDTPGILHDLTDHTQRIAALDEALSAMQDARPALNAPSLSSAEERRLQRLFHHHTGRTPVFWRRLARWRKAMRWLNQPIDLAEVAFLAGYADQAHMTNECRRWCGLTPRAARVAQARGDIVLVNKAFA